MSVTGRWIPSPLPPPDLVLMLEQSGSGNGLTGTLTGGDLAEPIKITGTSTSEGVTLSGKSLDGSASFKGSGSSASIIGTVTSSALGNLQLFFTRQ